jgi:hypothetical protein
MYWLLIAKLRVRESATRQVREAALKALSLTSDPSVSHWAWLILRDVGHTPAPAEKDQVLGVAFEHWVPGTLKGWAMVCTYNDAAPRLYLSWGAGMIGNVALPGVREKAERLLSAAITVVGRMSITEEPALPEKKEMAIYVLTLKGVKVAMEREDHIHNGNGPFAAIGFTAAELIEKLMETHKANQAL